MGGEKVIQEEKSILNVLFFLSPFSRSLPTYAVAVVAVIEYCSSLKYIFRVTVLLFLVMQPVRKSLN